MKQQGVGRGKKKGQAGELRTSPTWEHSCHSHALPALRGRAYRAPPPADFCAVPHVTIPAVEVLINEQKRSLSNKDNISHSDHIMNLPVSEMGRKEGYEPKLAGSEKVSMAMAGFSQHCFTYEELAAATNGFSDSNLLGQGGFGFVHKGVLTNGKEVAVKQLRSDSKQGVREFQAEIDIISLVHHRHLVSLVGYCIAGEKLLLVYDFVPNGTLEFHLHGKGQPTMQWSTRMKIALGSAKGLAYLHEDCHPSIIHRDIKASNILLDADYEAQVADFGLAKFFCDGNTHVSTRIMGTIGYLAPEYAASGKLTGKSDVYSFGVLLLELITGSRPTGKTNDLVDDSLVEWARPLLLRALDEGNYDTVVDPRLQEGYNSREMAYMVACAAACIRHSAKRRPLMSQIVHVLEGEVSLDTLNQGIKSGHTLQLHSLSDSSSQSSNQYVVEVKDVPRLPDSSSTSSSGAHNAFSTVSDRRSHQLDL